LPCTQSKNEYLVKNSFDVPHRPQASKNTCSLLIFWPSTACNALIVR
jgi:hypothetical protein